MIVNTNNVQSQFQALLSSKTELLQTLKQLEAEHASEQNALHQIRTETSSLSTQFQTSKYQHGTLTKKRALLNTEIARLTSLMKEDERDLKALAEDVRSKEQKEWENKMEFVREMEAVNEQWRDVLRRTEEEKMKRCQWMTFHGCLEIAKVLEELWIKQPQNQQQQNQQQQNEISGMSDPMGVNTNERDNDSQKHVVLMQDIIYLVQEWAVSVEEHKQVNGTLDAWKERVVSLRTQVLKDNKEGLGEDELDELERQWGETSSIEDVDVGASDSTRHEQYAPKQQDGPINMTLFYGTYDHQEDDEADAM